MADYRSMFDANYLYSFDLKGRDVTATIKEVKVGKLKNAQQKEERKPVIFFAESKDKRGLVANKTNCRTIAAMYGNDVDAWIGKRITLFPTQCDAFGKPADCIRIRPIIPTKGKSAGEFAEAQVMPPPEAPEHADMNEREPGSDG